jgi:hypothetical protein
MVNSVKTATNGDKRGTCSDVEISSPSLHEKSVLSKFKLTQDVFQNETCTEYGPLAECGRKEREDRELPLSKHSTKPQKRLCMP